MVLIKDRKVLSVLMEKCEQMGKEHVNLVRKFTACCWSCHRWRSVTFTTHLELLPDDR
ncbi:hypothetical protein HanPI659440_Chr14g0554641 [Helianthus annuus]|nr:hypothetical protein HanPI659440_Chr14g0554641 [Helianthus annuus]